MENKAKSKEERKKGTRTPIFKSLTLLTTLRNGYFHPLIIGG